MEGGCGTGEGLRWCKSGASAMEYDDYVNQARAAGKLDEDGDTEGALAIFRGLIEARIAEFDRALMCYNAGILLDKLGRTDEALAAYDRGIALETPLCRHQVSEQKAALLHKLG